MERLIWFYWAQGWRHAPWFVKRNYQSWLEQNPEWKVTFIDDSNLEKHSNAFSIVSRNGKYISKTAFSDVLRLDLLARYGGAWVDSTLLCMAPLNCWLPEVVRPSGFFAFRSRCQDRDLASWHLAANAQNYLVTQWLNLATWYWSQNDFNNPDPWMPIIAHLESQFGKNWETTDGYFSKSTLRLRVYPYFWANYLHQRLMRTDQAASNIWQETPEIVCGPQSTFLQKDALLPLDDYTEAIVAMPDIYMLKFDRRRMPEDPPSGSALEYLYGKFLRKPLLQDPLKDQTHNQ